MALEDQEHRTVTVKGDSVKVPARGLDQWELNLIESYLESPQDHPRKSYWVRGWLRHVGPDYSRSIHQNYVAFVTHPTALRLAESDDRLFKPGSYGSTRTMIYLLKRAGAIEVMGTEPSPESPVDRNYYELVEFDHPAWESPHKYVYG